jgi:hypothetical protein
MDRYDIGDLAQLTATFTDDQGDLVEPDTVLLVTRDPAGAETEHPGISDGDGVYHVDLQPAVSGTWAYRWVATGAGRGAEPGQFHVRPAFYPAYRPSVAQVASHLEHRTYHQGSGSTGTFTSLTNPTADQAEAAIDTATGVVLGRLPVPDVPAASVDAARNVIAIRAAMQIEISHPAAGSASTYDRLKDLFDDDVKALIGLVKDAGDGAVDGSGGGNLPTHTFPCATPLEW